MQYHFALYIVLQKRTGARTCATWQPLLSCHGVQFQSQSPLVCNISVVIILQVKGGYPNFYPLNGLLALPIRCHDLRRWDQQQPFEPPTNTAFMQLMPLELSINYVFWVGGWVECRVDLGSFLQQ